MIRNSLLVLALLASTAVAQPGATQPTEPAPPTPAAPAPPPTPAAPLPPIIVDRPDGNWDIDVDAAVTRVEASMPSLEKVVLGTVRRARRAISIGPTAGLWTAAIIDPGNVDAALTFGVGFETFKVPVMPDMQTLRAL